MNVYEVGMGTDVTEVAAPNAATAAMYYGVNLANTNAPSMVAVYKENGQDWDGDAYWMGMGFLPDEEAQELFERLKEEIGDGVPHSGEMLWWCPRDGSEPVYGWHEMIYRGKELSEQCDICFRDEAKALRHTLHLIQNK